MISINKLILLQKCIYPYEYMSYCEKFIKEEQAEKEDFCSHLIHGRNY